MHSLQQVNVTKVNLDEATRFLETLDPNAFSFTFQTFDDVKTRKDKQLTFLVHNRLDQISDSLIKLNNLKAGIFVTVNETDGKGRKRENIRRVRAIWGEFDNGPPPSIPLDPSIIVETSPKKYHYYWLVDGLSFEQHKLIMEQLIEGFGSDPNAKDISRVLRLPGFFHHKEKPFCSRIIDLNGKFIQKLK